MNRLPPVFIPHGLYIELRFDDARYQVGIDFETKAVSVRERVPVPPSGPIPEDRLVGEGEWEGTWEHGRIVNRTGSLRSDHFDRAEAELRQKMIRDRESKN